MPGTLSVIRAPNFLVKDGVKSVDLTNKVFMDIVGMVDDIMKEPVLLNHP